MNFFFFFFWKKGRKKRSNEDYSQRVDLHSSASYQKDLRKNSNRKSIEKMLKDGGNIRLGNYQRKNRKRREGIRYSMCVYACVWERERIRRMHGPQKAGRANTNGFSFGGWFSWTGSTTTFFTCVKNDENQENTYPTADQRRKKWNKKKTTSDQANKNKMKRGGSNQQKKIKKKTEE